MTRIGRFLKLRKKIFSSHLDILGASIDSTDDVMNAKWTHYGSILNARAVEVLPRW